MFALRIFSLLVALPLAAFAAPQPGPGDDPAAWRERGDGSPTAVWDGLEGRPLPSLQVLDGWTNGGPFDWKDLEGRVVLVEFLATSRKPAVRDIPSLVDLYERYRDQGLVVLGIHAKRDAYQFPSFVIRRGIPYLVAADVSGALGRAVGARKLPVYHLVGRDGRVRIAGLKRDPAILDAAIRAALAEPWQGEMRPLELIPRHWIDPRKKPTPLVIGAGGWPSIEVGPVRAARDVRGKPAPMTGVTHWVSEPVEIRAHPYLLFLWSTVAATCLPELPHIQKIHERFAPALTVLAVSEQAPNAWPRSAKHPWANRALDFLHKRTDLTYANALDGKRTVIEALHLLGLPHALLVDSRGITRWQGNPASPDYPLTDEIIRRFLAIDRLREGGTRIRRGEGSLLLEAAPPGQRGYLMALPEGSARPTPGGPGGVLLGLTAPVGDDGRLEIPLPEAALPLPPILTWSSRRPEGYDGPLPWSLGE